MNYFFKKIKNIPSDFEYKNSRIIKIIMLGFMLLVFGLSNAATITSTATGGVWETGTTWVGGVAPTSTDTVIIATTGTNSVTGNTSSMSYTCAGLIINSGSILTMLRPLTVNGNTSISGRINFGSTSSSVRAMVFNGTVTLNSGAIWDETNGGANTVLNTFSFSDSFTNNATTFTTLTGNHTFSGVSKTLSGSTLTSIPSVTFTGAYTNSGTLTVTTALSGTGGLTQGTTGVLNIGGTSTITTLTATATGNTVNFNGSVSQTIPAINYYNLTSSSSGARVLASTGTIGIAGTFTKGTNTYTTTGSTVNFNSSADQAISTIAYNNLTLSGSGTKTFAAATTVNGNLSVASGVVANLGTFSSTAATLTLGGTVQTAGGVAYGGTGSTGTTVNTTYFSAVSGKITVGIGCTSGTWLGTTSTDWNTATNWCNATLPTSTTDVIISSGGNQPTIGAAGGLCRNITINTSATLTVGSTGTLSVSGAITKNGNLTLTSGSTVNYAGGTQSVLNVTYSNLTLSGTSIKTLGGTTIVNSALTINSGATLATNNSSLTLGGNFINSGTISAGSSSIIINGTANQSIAGFTTTGTVSMTKTAGTATFIGAVSGSGLTINGTGGTLNLGVGLAHTFSGTWTRTAGTLDGGSSSITFSKTGTSMFSGTGGTFTSSTSTVIFSGTGQTLPVLTYNNLTLSGTGTNVKTFATSPTVNGLLSMEGTATITLTSGSNVTYGTAATLQYNTGTNSRTVSTKEWPATFLGSGGVLIKGTGIITLDAAKVLGTNSNVPLNITSGAKLATGNFGLTFHGNFINAGTFTAGSSPIVITGTTATQYIAGFTTTGAVSMTKTSGTATVTGAISAAALTIDGAGGTLNLGTSFTHTLSGDVTLTAGTLNGGALTTINANSSSTSAWTGTGSVFVPGTSTVSFGGIAQTVGATSPSFYNVSFSGTSATKTISNALTVTNNLNITSSAVVLLPNGSTSTTKILKYGGTSQGGGSYGGTGSSATNTNATYFGTSTTGILSSSTSQRLVITGTSAQTAGAFQTITITAQNADNSTVTGYNGDKVITFSGASTASNGTEPTIKDKNGAAVAFGTPTTITFTNGVAIITNGMLLFKSEIADISATDGLILSSGSDRLTVTVSPATSSLVFTTQPNGGATNTEWISQPIITWQDAYGNLNTGTANNVTLAIGTNPSSGNLNGTKTVTLNTLTAQAAFSGLSIDKAGTGYTLSATGTTGTGNTSSAFNITNPLPILTSISPNTICSGIGDNTITINGSNFNAASVVKINNVSRTTTFIDNTTLSAVLLASDIVSSGTSTITVDTPGGGTSAGTTLTVTQVAINPTITQPTCFSDGSISLAPSGGTGLYSIDWNDLTGNTNPEDRTGLPPGDYAVTVTDANGCATTSGTYTLIAATGCSGITVCKSDTASLLSVPPDPNNTSYTWSLPTGAIGSSTSESISVNWTGVAVGSYTVSVVANNNCGTSTQSSMTVYVQEPLVSASADLACSGSNLNLYASGGVSYSWTGPNGFTSQSANPVIYNVTSTQSGTYSVTVTNAAGCSKIATVSVTVNTPPSVTNGTITQSTTGNSVGAIPITASGGTSFSYLWSSDNTDFSSTAEDITGLFADNYTVVVTNQTGCSTTKTFTVSNSDGPVTSLTPTNVTCNGSNNGVISLTTTPISTDTFSYSWSGPGNFSSTSNTTITGLVPGTYTVVTTDNITSATGVTSVTITEPSALQVDGIVTNVNCNGSSTGSITLSVSGGSSTYSSYSWTGPAGFTASTKNISSLAAGNYTVTITDSNSCTLTQSFTIIQPAAAISATTTITDVGCYGSSTGQVILETVGGTSPYTYAWSGPSTFTASTKDITGRAAGSYSVTITDAKSCSLSLTGGTAITIAQPAAVLSATITSQTNVSCKGNATGAINITVSGGTSPYTYSWSNGAVTEDLSSLAAGTYSLIVTDSKSCTTSVSVTITEPNNVLSASTIPTAALCKGGATGNIILNVTGGTSGYTYLWSNSTTTQNLSNVTAGIYAVTITDSKGCTTTSSSTVTEPNAISVAASVTNILCNGGTTGAINITATGGTGNYTYDWNDVSGTNNPEDRIGLIAGTYSVTVTDANSCSSVLASFVVSESSNLSLSTTLKNVLCKGSSNGSISLSVSGGAFPYTYFWTGSNGFTATTTNLDNIPAGIYSVTVTDANSCSKTLSSIIITEPAVILTVGATPSAVTCFGGSNGSILALATGGSSSYTYSWSTGATTAAITGLSAGNYSVMATDSNGCVASYTTTVTQPSTKIQLYANTIQSSSCGTATGSIDLTVVNGNPPFTYSWTNTSQTVQDPTALVAGTYTVTVSDNIGCSATLPVTINTAPALSASVTTYPKTCLYNDGTAYAIVNGGVPPYTYLWSNSATTSDIGLLGSGLVTVTVTDSNGCSTIVNGTVGSNSCMPPIAVADVFTTNYNTTLNGTVATNDSDPDGGASPVLQFFDISNPTPAQGTLAWGTDYDGSFTFIPSTNYSGTFTLKYKVFDITGLSSEGTYPITVGPNAINDAIGTASNTPFSGNVATNDIYQVGSIFTKISNPTKGNLVFNSDGTYTYTPNLGASGDDSFTYQVCLPSPNSGICSTATVLISINGLADMRIAKTVNNATPNVGSNVVFTLTATNSGPNVALGVSVTDLLPSGYTYVSNTTPSSGSFDSSTGIWTLGSVANAASEILTITAKVNASGSYSNSATISSSSTDPVLSNNSSTVSTVPVPQSDLSIVKTVNNPSQNVGQPLVFTLTVTNNGPSTAAGVVVNDLLPSGYTYVSNAATAGNYSNSSGVWTIGSLANGVTTSLNITAIVNPTGIYTNTASISSTTTDPTSTNNTSTITPVPGAVSDLKILKTVNNSTPYTGEIIEFTLVATNDGPSDATGVVVTDALPTGYTYISDNGGTATNVASGTVTWTIGNISNLGVATLKILAKVNASGIYNNTASITTTNQPDSNTSNNTSSVITNPIAQADLMISKTVDNSSPVKGSNVVFAISVTNNGPSAAAGVVVNDLLPSGYTYVSNTTSQGSYVSNTGLWTIGNLSNTTTATLSIIATVNVSGNYVNTASVSASTIDLISWNNSSTRTIVPVSCSLLVPSATLTQPTCTNPTGTIVFTTQSGVEYSIDEINYQSSATFTGVTPGAYRLKVRSLSDATCTSSGSAFTVNAAPSAPSTPAGSVTVQPTCGTPTGTIVFTTQSGIGYSINGTTYQSSATFTGVSAGTYTLKVRSTSDNTCTATGSTVTVNAAPSAPSTPAGSVTVQPTCGTPTGTIVFTTQSGVEYSINGTTYQSSATFTGVSAGTYTLKVRSTSDNTCTATGSTVTVNAAPGAPSTPAGSVTVQPTCGTPTGTIVFTTQSGVEYSINGTTYQSSATFTGVSAGTYTLKVRSTADNTCTATGSIVTVNAQPATPAAPTASVTQPTCTNPTGTIVFTTQSGVEYSIDEINYQSSATFTGVTPGAYRLKVRSLSDATCTSSGSAFTVNAAPSAPSTPAGSVTVQPTCGTPTGTIVFTTQSGIGYSINGTTYQSSATFTGVSAGTYTLKVRSTSDNTCTATGSTVTVNAAPSAPSTPAGSVTVQPTCGTPTGTIVFTTQSGVEYSINGTTYQSSATFTGVSAGTYTLKVRSTSDNTCTATGSTVTVNAAPGAPSTPAGSVTVQPTCGTPTGTIVFTTQSGVEYSINGTTYQSSATFTGVSAGTYTLKVRSTADNTCTATGSIVTVNAQPATPAAPTASVTQPTCTVATGTITVTSTGNSGYTYSINGTTYQSSTVFSSVVSGTYNVTIKTSAGCISAATIKTIVSQSTLICDSDGDGIIDSLDLCPTVPGFNSTGCPISSDVNATNINVPVNGSVATNDTLPAGTSYGTPVSANTNPSGGSITMNANGTYTFTGTTPGKYIYNVPVCAPGQTTNCPTTPLEITVLDPISMTNLPVANNDIATVISGGSVSTNVLANDKTANNGTLLNPASVTVTTPPSHGTVSVNPTTGAITYTPNTGYVGTDVLTYIVCDTSSPTPICQTAQVEYTVKPIGSNPITTAADDYTATPGGTNVTGNVMSNDANTSGATLTASVVSGPTPSQGTFTMNPNGTYTFTPAPGFSGPVDVVYEVCGGTPVSCAKATLHILVQEPPVLIGSPTDDGVEIFNSISPNGDGDNDVFVIRNIDNYPNNTVSIYNRWGLLVYEVDGYGQNDKVFKGISEGRVTVQQAQELPEGTYFYILRYVNFAGDEKQRSGYLYIKR
jgi:uncharacterized repeat protein (TIGR01451 family)/gliding motility-associated-like protein